MKTLSDIPEEAFKSFPKGIGGSMKWQPIKTAPKDGTVVLLFYHECTRANVGRFIDRQIIEYGVPKESVTFWRVIENNWVDRHWGDWPTPTHWMPLPKPPKVRCKR